MKILDRYILTSFLKTFGSVFIILFFIFILQGIWLFIAELAGKDLDAWLVVKFLAFYSPTIVPLVLPLSILLASIMTFGNFAENYEFAAMKSSGISLSRAMRSLMIFIFGLSIVAFIFANNVIPRAQYKFINLRRTIVHLKPAMAIAEGQFNAIGSFNIKVDKKSGENGEKLSGVTIHKRRPADTKATVIRSESGLLHSDEASNSLKLELFDGYYYEELDSKNPAERQRVPFAKSSFSRQVMNIDLSVLNNTDDQNQDEARTNNMLNMSELNYTLDSLETGYEKEKVSLAENLVNRVNTNLFRPAMKRIIPKKEQDSTALTTKKEAVDVEPADIPDDLLSLLETPEDKGRVLEIASNSLSGTEFSIVAGQNALKEKVKNINSHWHALYEKFVIAFACILMFFIGAPLGAIIRKGGLGLPIVFAVLIFIIFHFINTFGKKLAQEDGITPFAGAWMSTFVLAPLAVLLTYRATNDIGLINMDNLLHPLQKLIQRLFKLKSKEEEEE